jgi:toxin ParE1/3/4
MTFRIEVSTEASCDLELIFDHLVETYLGFGENLHDALDHAEARVRSIRKETERLGAEPYRGSAHNDLLPGLRHLTLNRAIYWFEISEELHRVRVLAIFFGGQDHIRHMMLRLIGEPPS